MFAPLFKRTSTGAVQVWQIRVEQQDDGTAVIITTHGQVGGKQVESRDNIRLGKNPGKKNATTPYQQAVKEATAKWQKQRDRNHYGLTVEESEDKKIVAPMLAQKYVDKDGKLTGYAKKIDWKSGKNYGQPKFDGHRCLAMHTESGIELFSRKGERITTCPHIEDALSSVVPQGMTVDGELYIHGVALATIGSYVSKLHPESSQLRLITYDLVDHEADFITRLNKLDSLVRRLPESAPVKRADTVPIGNEDTLLQFQEDCVAAGYEGAMLRCGNTGYEAGKRSGSLLKVKTFLDGEVTIVGCREGRGKFEGAATFECITDDGNKVDVTAPGTMEEKKAYWRDREKYVGKRLTIKYQKMTETANPVPFQPTARCIRD